MDLSPCAEACAPTVQNCPTILFLGDLLHTMFPGGVEFSQVNSACFRGRALLPHVPQGIRVNRTLLMWPNQLQRLMVNCGRLLKATALWDASRTVSVEAELGTCWQEKMMKAHKASNSVTSYRWHSMCQLRCHVLLHCCCRLEKSCFSLSVAHQKHFAGTLSLWWEH